MIKTKKFLKEQVFLITGVLTVIVLFLFTYNVPFFWDAILKSERATWFYEHNFSQWVVPTEINSGHPPLWTWLLAFSWQLFGKTLLVSRLLLLSLNIAVVFQLQQFIKTYGSNNISNSWYLLLLLEPTYLAQTTILNNDVLLLLMCLIAANNIFKNRTIYSIALVGVLFCNTRGLLFFTGFFFWDVAVRLMDFYYKHKRQQLICSYIFPTLIYIAFLAYEYFTLGWVVKTPTESLTTEIGFSKALLSENIVNITWVFLDYGRFVFWILSVFFLRLFYKKRKKFNAKSKKMLSLWICVMVANLVMIFFSNAIAHRYFMFLYIVGLFVCINLMHLVWDVKKARVVTGVIALSLISGHFWMYPAKLPQGWDSSLAYLNYFEIKDNMKEYILEQQIPVNKVGTNIVSSNPKLEYLSKGNQMYIQSAHIDEVFYYIHSNIENTTKKEEIDALQMHWKLLKEYKKGSVFVRLYAKSQE